MTQQAKKVVCMHSDNNYFTPNKVYEVVAESPEEYCLISDVRDRHAWESKAFFRPLSASEEKKIEDELDAAEAVKVLAEEIEPLSREDLIKMFNLASEGLKHDQGKSRLELLSSIALVEMAKVMGHGAIKYGDHNWRKGFKWSRLYGAALRHILAHMNGQNNDSETGLSHLAHAACCIMFLQEHELLNLGTDDRYKHSKGA